MNTTSFYQPQQDMMFSAQQQQVDQYNGYFTSLQSIESSLLSFQNTKMEASFYPSPTDSPLSNEMVVTPDNTTEFQYGLFNDNSNQYLDSMMMVPPLGQFSSYDVPVDAFMLAPSYYEHKAPAIELVDQFIAQHEAALSLPEQPSKETNWSYWTYSRDSTPEIVSDTSASSASSTVQDDSTPIIVPEVSISKNKKTNKVTKQSSTTTTTTTRRGRGKGVKNSAKKAALAAAAAASTTIISTSKEPIEGALYVCQHDDCGRSFTRPYNLTSHMRTHTSERPYACSHCGRKFARQHDRNRHEKLHWGIRPYACHHCHKSFARMDALNRHLRMENGCTGVHL